VYVLVGPRFLSLPLLKFYEASRYTHRMNASDRHSGHTDKHTYRQTNKQTKGRASLSVCVSHEIGLNRVRLETKI